MRIRQVAPQIAAGTGVGGVAAALEQEFAARGIPTERFTMREARGDWLPAERGGLPGHAIHAVRIVWFSTVGTALLRRRMRHDAPGVVTITHNDAVAGDVYVNHGLLRVAMQARGNHVARLLRNPTHVFTSARDYWRYSHSEAHSWAVNLAHAETVAMRRLYPKLTLRVREIGNGVDLQRFRPAAATDRARTRATLGIPETAYVLIFIGHEHRRKRLHPLLEALSQLPDDVWLIVIGGTEQEVNNSRQVAERCGAAERTIFTGRVTDPVAYLQAADCLALPSAYEAYALVLPEALACGLAVVATPVGAAAELVHEGRTGALCDGSPAELTEAIQRTRNLDRDAQRAAARDTANGLSWRAVAEHYVQLANDVLSERAMT